MDVVELVKWGKNFGLKNCALTQLTYTLQALGFHTSPCGMIMTHWKICDSDPSHPPMCAAQWQPHPPIPTASLAAPSDDSGHPSVKAWLKFGGITPPILKQQASHPSQRILEMFAKFAEPRMESREHVTNTVATPLPGRYPHHPVALTPPSHYLRRLIAVSVIQPTSRHLANVHAVRSQSPLCSCHLRQSLIALPVVSLVAALLSCWS